MLGNVGCFAMCLIVTAVFPAEDFLELKLEVSEMPRIFPLETAEQLIQWKVYTLR